jgi:tetratricopeptide (TPR) repeat protein
MFTNAPVICKFQKGDYNIAQLFFQRALSIRQTLLGNETLLVADSMNSLASVLKTQHEFEEAETFLRTALRIRTNLLGLQNEYTAETMNELAVLLKKKMRGNEQSYLAEAFSLCEQSLVARERILGNHHPRYAASLNTKASLLRKLKKLDDALLIYQQCANIYKAYFQGENHTLFAQSINNVAWTLLKLGRIDEAITYYRLSLHIHLKLYGESHLKTNHAKHNLGLALATKGDKANDQEAETLLTTSLEVRKSISDGNNVFVAQSLDSLARLRNHQGRTQEAAELHKIARIMREYIKSNNLLGNDDAED